MADFSKIGRSNVQRSKSHERRCAKLLTDWSGVEFRRRRVEGRDTLTISLDSTSDIVPINENFRFTVEAKCEKGFSLNGLLTNPINNLFTGWWLQTCYDAQLLGQIRKRHYYSMLFFKPHPNHDWLAISEDAMGILKFKSGTKYTFPYFKFPLFQHIGQVTGDVSHTKNKKLVQVSLDPVVFCRWNDFAGRIESSSAFFD